MSNHPPISIIMPLYNKASYVRRAINSIQEQTFSDWELIIVDDGSDDGSIAEIPQSDSRIRMFQQKNAGPGAARNRGIRAAQGEIITFIDADDYYYPEKLDTEIDLLCEKKFTKWMLSPFEFEKDGHIITRYVKDINATDITEKTLICNNAINEIQLHGIHINGICIRKDLLEHLGGFREDMRCFEITELLIRAALAEPGVLVNAQPLFRVVDVPGSAFKISSYRIEGMRLQGESLYQLSTDYAEYSDYLTAKSRALLYSYVSLLILEGRAAEARNYLMNCFPFTRDKRWWKMWVGSLMPQRFLKKKYVRIDRK